MGSGGGLGAVIGGALGGPFGAIAGGVIGNNSSVPQYTAPQIDSGTQGLINSQQQTAQTKTAGQYAQQFGQGNDQAQAAGTNNQVGEALSHAQGGGYGAAGMQAAIQNKTAKNFETSMGTLNNQQQSAGAGAQMGAVNQATNNAVSLNNYSMNVTNQVNSLNTQANGLQYQLLSGILGGAGSFAGAMAGSGAGGGGGGGGAALGSMPQLGSGASPTTNYNNALGNYNF